jgi:hypothetical protein
MPLRFGPFLYLQLDHCRPTAATDSLVRWPVSPLLLESSARWGSSDAPCIHDFHIGGRSVDGSLSPIEPVL